MTGVPAAETTVSSPDVEGLSMRRLSDAPGQDRLLHYRHVATRPRFNSTSLQDVGAEFAFHCRHQLAELTRASAMRRSSDGFSLATRDCLNNGGSGLGLTRRA